MKILQFPGQNLVLEILQIPGENLVSEILQFLGENLVLEIILRQALPGYIGTKVFHSLGDFLPFVYSRGLVGNLTYNLQFS